MAANQQLDPIQPVHWGNTGIKVSNLHKGLLYLLRNESITENDLEMILKRLRPEIRAKKFGGVTAEYVGYYQVQTKQQLPNDAPPDCPTSAPVRQI
jgi:hypothetical protein